MKMIKDIWKHYLDNRSQMFIYAFAFSLMLSLAPLMTVFVVLFKQFALDINYLASFISAYLPAEEVLQFIEYLENNDTQELIALILSLATAIYLSSHSAYSFLKFSSDLEQVGLPGWRLRIMAFWQQFIFITIITLMIVIVSYSGVASYVFVFTVLLVGFLVYYRNLSFKHRKIKYHWKGALFTTLALILIGFGFVYYVETFTRYESLYGPLASLMVMLLAIYVVAVIIYIGFLINFVSNNPS